MSEVFQNLVIFIDDNKQDEDENNMICVECKSLLIETKNRLIVCSNCGYTPHSQIALEQASYKSSYTWSQVSYFPTNHLFETFKRLEGTEQTEIPEILLLRIQEELSDRYIYPSQYFSTNILYVMRYLTLYCDFDCRSYFENIYKIIRLLTGIQLISFEYEQKECIIEMFKHYVEVFNYLTPEEKRGRKSLHEYSYLVYMFSLIKGYTNITQAPLALIKGHSVIEEYNRLFTIICNKLKWPITELQFGHEYINA